MLVIRLLLSIRPGTLWSSGRYSAVKCQVYFGSFQLQTHELNFKNALRSSRVLSVNCYLYKEVLMKMTDIFLS